MVIETVNRPWNKKHNQGNRYNADPFYHTPLWARTRHAFILSEPIKPPPPLNGVEYKNHWCIECWKRGEFTKTHTVDHIIPIKQGGDRLSFINMQGLCKKDHDRKSAEDGNKLRRK